MTTSSLSLRAAETAGGAAGRDCHGLAAASPPATVTGVTVGGPGPGAGGPAPPIDHLAGPARTKNLKLDLDRDRDTEPETVTAGPGP